MRHLLFCLLLLAGSSACARGGAVQPASPSLERVQRGQLKSVELQIARSELFKALQHGAPTNNVRLVPVFRGTGGSSRSEEPPPQYRFFDVRPNSAYQLLGLKNNDVLVKVEDYVLYKPENFPEYVKRLLDVQRGWIEIRRAGEPLLLTYVMR